MRSLHDLQIAPVVAVVVYSMHFEPQTVPQRGGDARCQAVAPDVMRRMVIFP